MKTSFPTSRNSTLQTLAAVILLTALSACVNARNTLPSSSKSSSTTGTLPNSTGTTNTIQGDSFKVANVTVVLAAGATSTPPTTTVYFDPVKSVSATGSGAPMMSSHCSGSAAGSAATAKACVCQYTWNETNATGATSVAYQRTVQTAVATAQAALITCPAPDVYNNEIADGTTVKLTVLPASGNSEIFTVGTYSFIKNNSQVTGSFRDAAGHSFENIMHYACYEQFKKGSVIVSKVNNVTNSKTGEPGSYPYANQFCVQNSSGTYDPTSCPAMVSHPVTYSAQAYYYNFFVRSTEVGDVNQWNDRYACPTIKEAIGGSTNVGSQGSLYPLDTNYALSVGKTPDFNIGVDAFLELANGGGDPVSAHTKTCAGAVPDGNKSNNGFVQGCLGFAAKPNADGTCPYFRDSNSAIRFTYRLRRYVAVYPPVFDAIGKAPTTGQSSDTIYVLDRPVTPPAGSDPLKPYTMKGPKPCPFALYDANGVNGIFDVFYSNSPNKSRPGYYSTNDLVWNGKNVDGTEFPNTDSSNSCSTAISLVKFDSVNQDLATFSIGTVHSTNAVYQHMYVRPQASWAPHYEEDTEFQACAPQAGPVIKDPPLHFSRDTMTGNVAWCAESYPSQNDHVPNIDRLIDPNKAPLDPVTAGDPALFGAPGTPPNKYVGRVKPFTSHIVKNSASSVCRATKPSSIPSTALYPTTGEAYHQATTAVDISVTPVGGGSTLAYASTTCDRTAVQTGNLAWANFPLLADGRDVETALAADDSYDCAITYDNSGSKSTRSVSPSNGCCGSAVQMNTGLFPVGSTSQRLFNKSAHLEPDATCQQPTY
jgi:hypothetical protein